MSDATHWNAARLEWEEGLRTAALQAASRMFVASKFSEPEDVIEAAKKFEAYLKGASQ